MTSTPKAKYSSAVTLLAAGTTIVAIMLALIYGYHRLWRSPAETAIYVAKEVAEGVKQFFDITPRVTVNQVVVVHEAYPICELATASRELTVDCSYTNTWLHSEKTMTIRGRFRAKGGFDLNESCVLDVQPSPLTIIARVPEPRLLSTEMLSHEILNSENGWWNKVSPADQKTAMDGLLDTAKTQAKPSITKEAKRNLEDKLRELVQQKAKECKVDFEYGFK